MTIKIPLSLGPSWLPKLGGILAALGAFAEIMPENLPGAYYIRPWSIFLGSVGASIIGMSSRQNNKTSEQIGVQPMPNPDAVPAPNPPPK